MPKYKFVENGKEIAVRILEVNLMKLLFSILECSLGCQ
nr:MAG: hypothetical protein CM15mV30_0560 [uncultured marine virus]